jgi:hypothetical protein
MVRRIAICRNIAFLILLAFSFVCIPLSSVFSQSAKADSCGQNHLPVALKQLLERSYSSWTIQDDRSLSKNARERWSANKPLSCPGAVEGQFLTASDTVHVLLLISREHPNVGYRVIAVGQENRAVVVETSDGEGSSNYFLQKVRTSDYFSLDKAKKFRPQSKDSFLVIDSAEQEYGADLYFWSDGRFRKEPVDE